MNVRAKMVCDGKSGNDEEGYRVIFHPVVGGSNENEQYFKYTPGGECRLEILNNEASAQFELGKEYYLTFEQAG